ncbi:MAG: sigma-70 family RNA polymerase sigma factor [Actinomycetota bacterium]|nr:sigma-70 family RNA polymerase sigma factor [Actinomycetota bacterium]MDD5666237.1 sigma-70 family RNA polymerase sigma factor [Actinomycetota bacterium]
MDEEIAGLEKRVGDDPDAFARLFELNYDRIFNFILYSTGDVEASLDLTSETFFKSLRAIRRFDPRRGSFTAWLYAIASREVGMYRRRLGRTGRHASTGLTFSTEVGEVRQAVSTEDIADARRELEESEDGMVLAPLLRELAPKYREVIFLRFFEDKPLQEIADMLGRPVGTVKAQCHRGLKILRGLMQPPEGPGHIGIWEAEREAEAEPAGEAGPREAERDGK